MAEARPSRGLMIVVVSSSSIFFLLSILVNGIDYPQVTVTRVESVKRPSSEHQL